jgi:hypothetical protein
MSPRSTLRNPPPRIGHEVAPGIILNRDNRRGLYNSATEGIFNFLNSPGAPAGPLLQTMPLELASRQPTIPTSPLGSGPIVSAPQVIFRQIFSQVRPFFTSRVTTSTLISNLRHGTEPFLTGFTLTRASAPVPEPSSSLLAAIASAFLLFRRKRR